MQERGKRGSYVPRNTSRPWKSEGSLLLALDVIPASDYSTREWAMRDANVIDLPAASVRLVIGLHRLEEA